MRKFIYVIIILVISIYGIMVTGPYLLLGLLFIFGIRFIYHVLTSTKY